MFSKQQIACISDIHLGVHQDSQRWHNIAISFANWLDQELIKHDIQDIVISGDVFHNRHEIGVNTLHTAYNFFRILEKYNITIITGNHDCYLRDKSDINSVSILQNKNITVFEELVTRTAYNKTITFCPWGIEATGIPKSDIIFGHFEIQNFKMNGHKICDHGVETQSLLDKADIIISGHFHYREHRKYHEDKSILYLGSPYELDFGDRDQEKGLTLLDITTLETVFIKNDITPKHKKIKLTELIENINPEYMSSIFTNNFVNLNIDKKIDPYKLDSLLNSLSQYKPLNVRTEFNVFEDIQLTEDIDSISIDVDTALHEFIDLLDTDVPKKDILDKSIELYKLSLVANE